MKQHKKFSVQALSPASISLSSDLLYLKLHYKT